MIISLEDLKHILDKYNVGSYGIEINYESTKAIILINFYSIFEKRKLRNVEKCINFIDSSDKLYGMEFKYLI